jgi:hypothetical protein
MNRHDPANSGEIRSLYAFKKNNAPRCGGERRLRTDVDRQPGCAPLVGAAEIMFHVGVRGID